MTTPDELAVAGNAFVVAAAGCGKTQLIAEAIPVSSGRQLVLTHTNAGVAALRHRLGRLGVPGSAYRVETITGFALRLATAYRQTSGFQHAVPTGSQWREVVDGALRVLDTTTGRSILEASFGGVYVDEYQDCNQEQHLLTVYLSTVLPTRVVGDPLQAIFDFAGQTLVNWDTLDENFKRLPNLATPWRWRDSNPALGEWLADARRRLERGQSPDFTSGPVSVASATDAQQVLACGRLRGQPSVVAIRKWARDAHAIARRLGGAFVSMEEIDSKDLFRACREIEDTVGTARALRTIEFAAMCMTRVNEHMSSAIRRLEASALPSTRSGAHTEAAVKAARRVAEDDQLSCVGDTLEALSTLPGVRIFRHELLREMLSALKLSTNTTEKTLEELAWLARNRTRYAGRRVDSRVVSRTLLVKGLEFDHAIVLDASEHDAKNLYVAMTRPRTSLTVLVGG